MSGLAEAAQFHSGIDADVARLLLESHGIDCVLFDAAVNSAYGGLFMPVRLMVPERWLERALSLLAEDGLI